MHRCAGTCVTGSRCKNKTSDTLCHVHTKKEVCSICLNENFKNSKSATTLECKHTFCKSCINNWIVEKGTNANCPMCRKYVSDWEFNCAEHWGINQGLIYYAEVVIYNINLLEIYESLFLSMVLNIFETRSYSDSEFQDLQNSINSDNKELFNKLIETKFVVNMCVKSGTLPKNCKKIHLIQIQ